MASRLHSWWIYQRDRPRWCTCGHDREFHKHYRAGTNCFVRGCDCEQYHRQWPWHGLLAGRLRRHRPSGEVGQGNTPG